ncbi:aldehyde dehydrogenase [Psychroflexus sp. CAK1W]|uniref:aldehyde dehydrogenase n=1 Tax=Psychroflexus curvus TaxID=2873595 RepID=UPI001CCE096B|nr:aldehyde dehydrogenase [Psychroflexus curvus]MBZ9626704.1 aldehyde dehydrogenase [Psychroflexus curvus]
MKEGEIVNLLHSQDQFLKSGAKSSVEDRISILKKFKACIKAHEQDIIEAVYKDFQKPEFEVLTTELFVAYKEINLFIKKLKNWSRPKSVSSAWLNFPSSDKIYHVPWGKILVIAPWNYPFQLAITPVIGALACGNSVVLKPSEHAPYTADVLEKIISEVFEAEQAKVIQGAVETAKLLLEQKWDYVFFTGSVPVGRIVSQQIAKHMTPHTLELGGKNPCIVDASANLDVAAKRICWGKFLNAGQTCIAPDYLLIDSKIKAKFQDKLISTLKEFYADGTYNDYARLIHDSHFDRLTNLLKNQSIIFGGETDSETNFLSPTLVESPDFSSPLMEEEIFGPILPLYSYSSFAELDTTITSFDKPLSLYVFSKSKDFVRRVNENFDFGGGVINDTIVHFVNDKLPFGGVGASGLGNYHGRASFETFTRKKSIVNRKTWLDIPIKYPPYTRVDAFKSFLNLFR